MTSIRVGNLRSIIALAVTGVVMAALLIAASNVWASNHCDATVTNSQSIQAAIDAADPGDTICVEAGTYQESLAINEDITLLGAQAGVDARGRIADESIITSSGEDAITLDNNAELTVDGFHIDEVLRFVLTNDSFGDIALRNNIFTNAESATGGYFWFRDNPGESFIFQQNYLADNELSNGLRIRAANGVVEIDISDNLWENNEGWAMNLNRFTGTVTGNVVRADEVQDLSAEPFGQWGMLFAPGMETDLTVTGNRFEKLSAQAIDFFDNFEGTASVEDNVMTDGFRGIVARDGANLAEVGVHFNCIDGNDIGVQNNSSDTLDATGNFWGDASGPTHPGNPGGSGDVVAGNVDFDDWLSFCPLVAPETKDDCKDGAWEDHGFRNQGQCIQFTETGRDSR